MQCLIDSFRYIHYLVRVVISFEKKFFISNENQIAVDIMKYTTITFRPSRRPPRE